jgi:O-antigen ligase
MTERASKTTFPFPLLDRIGTIAATVYLCSLPFNHSAAIRSVTLFVATLCAAIIWWRDRRPRLPLIGMFSIWFVVATTSLLWTRDISASVIAIWHDIIRSALVVLSFYVIARRESNAMTMALGSLVSWIVLAVLAVTSYLKSQAWLTDVLPDVGNYAVDLATVVPLFLVYALIHSQSSATRWKGVFIIGASLVLLATGLLTHNRAMWLGLASAVVVGGLVWLWDTRHAIRPWQIVSLPVIAAMAIAAGGIAAEGKGRPLTYFEDRAFLYSTVLDKVTANPWFGTGYGYETDQAWYRNKFVNTPVGQIPTTHSHNIVLSMADQLGFPGVLVLFVIFGSIIRELYVAGRIGSRLGFAVSAIAIGMVTGVFVMNNFNVFFVRQHLWLFFAHIGIYLGLLRARSAGGLV